ncbi:MAG: hypothetical protein IJX26_03370, partial [Clostridia bacterium]|nr:hypothetical protein [Clostridia bacterium]
ANKVDEQLSETTEAIKALTKQVEEVVNEPVVEQPEEVKYFHYSTEDQYLERIAVLEERLRVAKKDLKTNDREFKPLEKVKKTLARDKAKLRRKQAIAAKKKLALYGVNNYVDLDKEKAEKFMRDLDLLEGLKLSVSHCEEVMTANADRYPILEHTHNILTNNINDIEADIASLNKELEALRDKNGSDKK